MANQPKNSYQDLWILGAVITVPFVLLSGPFAGYVIGRYLLVKYLHWSQSAVFVCVGLGLIGSGLHVYQLIQTIRKFDLNNKK